MVMDTNFRLTNLVGNSKYHVIIYAATIAGTGAESSIETTTVPGPCTYPVLFTVLCH